RICARDGNIWGSEPEPVGMASKDRAPSGFNRTAASGASSAIWERIRLPSRSSAALYGPICDDPTNRPADDTTRVLERAAVAIGQRCAAIDAQAQAIRTRGKTKRLTA